MEKLCSHSGMKSLVQFSLELSIDNIKTSSVNTVLLRLLQNRTHSLGKMAI